MRLPLTLAHRKVDVIVLNYIVAHQINNNGFYKVKLIGDEITLGDGYGIVALNDKAELMDKINKAILSIQADGTYIEIYENYYKP